MLYTITTNKNIDMIKNEIASKAKEQGFGVLKEYHFIEILKEKGFPIEKDITVFEVCNPAAAQNILNLHPEVSVFLPCRISLYEKDDKVVISTIGVDNILQNFELEEEIKTYMHDIFEKTKNILKNLK
ncbi:MAG: DUF302 domain-containing protein [Campylobacteraceae bacterium]|nr:DUF302 domain-containing protein [Campylobacteraceae bacterium]